MNRAAIHGALDALLDAIQVAEPTVTPVPDELIPLNLEALDPRGIELRPAIRAAERGELRTVHVGRRRLTTMRWLYEWATSLPVDAADAAPEAVDDLARAARRRAARRSAA